jgi:hypothetical protein
MGLSSFSFFLDPIAQNSAYLSIMPIPVILAVWICNSEIRFFRIARPLFRGSPKLNKMGGNKNAGVVSG